MNGKGEQEIMKLLQKPIDAMVVFQVADKHPRPWKFKIEEKDGEKITVFVDRMPNL